ncbi:hypothetical protein L9F63_012322 [Diploptera punctata]|uniref:Mitochondrial ribonuclease P catalytic subunit n=1 Tax=Diploptera punctata TaxID=6984 RepID=A0AAD8ADB9_DIPPU|nr:hypothetical protein L9F63_012322 [Diploptera punctata]
MCMKRSLDTFPSQTYYFSVKLHTVKTVSESDKEKFSDSDSDSESPDNEDILESIMKVKKPLTSLEWENVKTEVCSKRRFLNEYNIDGIVLLLCIKYKQLGIGLSYLEHLSQIGKKPNFATVGHFMRLCYNCQEEGVNEQLILSLYDELRAKCSVLDASTSENMILGLCLTSRWREAVELIDMIKLTCNPGGLEYCAVIKKAFENDEVGLSTKCLEEMLQIGRLPRPEVYLSWLDYLDRLCSGDVRVRWRKVEETVLSFLVDNDLVPTRVVAERLREWHKVAAPGNCSEFTSVTHRGVCKSCKKFLNPIKITRTEFEKLQSAFLEKVVIGRDMFSKTTPEELENFKRYVKSTAPYDIVLDGLNIAYAMGKKNSYTNFAFSLEKVVEHFTMKSQKVLVLGRKHMQSWPRKYMNSVYKNARVFLAQNMSQDDPFLLYAALYSGEGTNFLSRDLMRSHSYLLKDKDLKSTFKRWQLQHQYQLQYITQQGTVHLKLPLNFNPMVQRSSDGTWHIPYDAEYSANPPEVFEAPTCWLCLASVRNSSRTK